MENTFLSAKKLKSKGATHTATYPRYRRIPICWRHLMVGRCWMSLALSPGGNNPWFPERWRSFSQRKANEVLKPKNFQVVMGFPPPPLPGIKQVVQNPWHFASKGLAFLIGQGGLQLGSRKESKSTKRFGRTPRRNKASSLSSSSGPCLRRTKNMRPVKPLLVMLFDG